MVQSQRMGGNEVNEEVKEVKEENKRIAKLIGINQAARTTCIKPEGTSSCILGTSSGIHPHHAKRYIRRVQANKLEPIYNYFKVNTIEFRTVPSTKKRAKYFKSSLHETK